MAKIMAVFNIQDATLLNAKGTPDVITIRCEVSDYRFDTLFHEAFKYKAEAQLRGMQLPMFSFSHYYQVGRKNHKYSPIRHRRLD
jgi:hypothetical protein